MTIPGYDSLVHYAAPPTNYIGAAIFLSYIAAALYATFKLVYSLYTQYIATFREPTKDEKVRALRAARSRHIKIYTFLASISFATLSYHMLMFLITHYLRWSRDQSRDVANISTEELKNWMLESTLFQDFARDLVKDAPNAVWTQAAILATWFWNIWIAQKAHRRNSDASTMRMYMLPSQILPISFTACLFIIQLHLTSPDMQPSAPPGDLKHNISHSQLQRPKPKASLQLPNILLNASLLAQSALRGHPLFSPLILFERAILLFPHSGLLSLRDQSVVKCITVAGGFLVANAAMTRRELSLTALSEVLGEGGYAVKALGWDAVLGGFVFGVLAWGGGV